MTPPIESFTTTRLSAERLTSSHFDFLQQMHSDPCVMATLGGVRDEVATRALIRANDEHWQRYGYGLWLFRDLTTGIFAGRGGLRHLKVGGGPEIEVAYALMSEFWNRGLATEMAVGIVRIAFAELHLDDLVCFTLPTNRASRRVMQKAGFLYERDVIHASLLHVFHRLKRDR